DADARHVAEITIGEEPGPPAAGEAEEEDTSPDNDEALHQGHEELRRDDGERDHHNERSDAGDEAGKEAVQETEIGGGVQDFIGQRQALVEDSGGAEVGESGGGRTGVREALDDRRDPRSAVQQQRIEEADRNDLAEKTRHDSESILSVQDPPDPRPGQLYGHEDPEDLVRDWIQRAEPGRADGLVVPDDISKDRGAHG